MAAFDPETDGPPHPQSEADRNPSPDGGRSMRVLERLATSLGVPVADFFKAEPERAAPAVAAEAAELRRIFLTIEEPRLRRRCLAFVRAAAARKTRGLSRPRRERS